MRTRSRQERVAAIFEPLERLTGALLDRLTHHVHILEMNGDSYRLRHSRQSVASQVSDEPEDS